MTSSKWLLLFFGNRNAKENSSIVVKKKKKLESMIQQRDRGRIQPLIYFPFHLNAFAMNYVVKDSFASQDSVTAQGSVSWKTTKFYFFTTSFYILHRKLQQVR